MIFFLCGPDEYRRARRVREVVGEFRTRHPQAPFARLDMAAAGPAPLTGQKGGARVFLRFQEFAHTMSMFEPLKMAVLDNVFEDGSKELAAELKQLAPHVELTIVISEKTMPAPPFGFLKSVSPPSPRLRRTSSEQATGNREESIRIEEFPQLAGVELLSWIRTVAGERDVALTTGAVKFLAEVYSKDTWRLATELDKVSGLTKRTIDVPDLENLGLETTPDFWGVMNGLKAPVPAKRLATLEYLLSRKEPGQKIFHMIAYQWPDRLEHLAAYDRAVKSGKLDYEEALTDLAIS